MEEVLHEGPGDWSFVSGSHLAGLEKVTMLVNRACWGWIPLPRYTVSGATELVVGGDGHSEVDELGASQGERSLLRRRCLLPVVDLVGERGSCWLKRHVAEIAEDALNEGNGGHQGDERGDGG